MRKKGLLGLFQSAPKFVKSPKTGVYLSCVMFHEDKVSVLSNILKYLLTSTIFVLIHT